MKIRVTTTKEDKQTATRIEAIDKNEAFEKRKALNGRFLRSAGYWLDQYPACRSNGKTASGNFPGRIRQAARPNQSQAPCQLQDQSIMPVTRKDGARGTESSTLPPAPRELKFGASDGFYREVRRRVDQYFRSSGRARRDCPRIYLKTALLVGWFVVSYILLVFLVATWWLAVPMAVGGLPI
jgi:hypothetical protein